jgi:hypothetical protein
MSYQIHIGRLSITSPETLQLSAGEDGKSLSLNGKFGGKEHTLDHIKYLRDELQSMSTMTEAVPLRYDGDASMNGYVKVRSVSIDVQKYLVGSISYQVDMEYVGREGDVQMESRLSGSLIENDFVTSGTTQQLHAPPGNSFAFYHPSNPASNVRTARDLTSSTATDSTNLYIKQSDTLRDFNSTYNVDVADFYKGACQIRMGLHMQRENQHDSDTVTESIRCGKFAGAYSNGDSVILENGIIKLVLGTSSTSSSFKLFIWDENQYATETEWVFSEGAPASGQQHGDLFAGFHKVQILANRPEVAIIRCTTYKDTTDRDKRLIVDFTLRRGSHYVGVITSYYTAGTYVNIALESAPTTAPNVNNIASGYIMDGTTSPEDGNYWFIGSINNINSSQAYTDNAFFQSNQAGNVFSFCLGYELVDPGTSAAFSYNEAGNVFKQYLDNVNEYQKLVKA